MISRQTIDEILLRTDIQSLIGGYVSLKRAGSILKGLCPFHSEKSPSFMVYPADNSFYCFGCGVGGDAITFIKKKENLDYPDAIVYLAKRAGITVIEDNKGEYKSAPKFDKDKMYRMNTDAAKYFHRCLFDNTPEARAALAYFTEKRGLSMATIKHFGLGFAPNSFDAFSKYMLARGYTYDELVEGFLCGRSESGRYYDAFRNRVMFPIIDVSGNVIAFGGRVMDDSKPKYKNSSDTPVFKKSRNLFALNFARTACQETLILCEGYMDVIALHAAGFTNAVATLGTAITAEQARMMSRYTKNVVISYDADEAGQKAAMRAIGMLGEVGLNVTILRVPGSKDPDEYIKTYGADKFREILSNTKSKFEYNMENILTKYDINLAQDKVKALHESVKLVSETNSTAERDIYIRIVAEKFGVDARSVKTDVDKIISNAIKQAKRQESERLIQASAGYTDSVNPDFIKAPAAAKNEETVLGLMLIYPEHRKHVFENELLYEADFFTELGKRVFVRIRDAYLEKTDNLIDFNESFSEDEVGRITRMKLSRMQLTNNDVEVLTEAIESLKSAVRRKSNESVDSFDALNKLLDIKRKKT